jgi:phosphoglycerate dehydrogenase-like enzyme
MKILFCGSGWRPIIDTIEAALEAQVPRRHQLHRWDLTSPLPALMHDVDVLLPSNARIDDAVLAAAPRLRLIQQPAVGVEPIDIAAARARGIPVCNSPGINHVAVAECALLLILALARRLPAAQQAFADVRIGEPLGRQLGGRLLGIVGAGNSGRALGERAAALGMGVRYLGRHATAEERRDFFASCDVISLHCPLDEQSRGLLGAEAFAQVKRGLHLVNVARGPVIDRDACLAALRDGTLGGLGLDVHWEEPWDPADEIYRDPRVVALPHIAGTTEEAADNVTAILLDNLARLERGAPLVHRADGL